MTIRRPGCKDMYLQAAGRHQPRFFPPIGLQVRLLLEKQGLFVPPRFYQCQYLAFFPSLTEPGQTAVYFIKMALLEGDFCTPGKNFLFINAAPECIIKGSFRFVQLM